MTADAFKIADDASLGGDWAAVRRALKPLIQRGDQQASIALGTHFALSNRVDLFEEGVALLKRLADAGSGHAANNLAAALGAGIGATDETRRQVDRYIAIARDSGFLATVSEGPRSGHGATEDE